MNLNQLLSQGRLVKHNTSKEEICNLLRLVQRDLKDSKVKAISADRRFATVYNAILQMATIILYCKGYKTKGAGHHFTIFQTMRMILGKEYYELADYFDSCRAKRNVTDYSYPGEISETEVDELIDEALKFYKVVLKWIKTNYSKYLND